MTKRKMNRMTMPLAMAALAGAMGALSGCGDLKNNTVHVQLVSYRPDGSLVLCASSGIYVYDGSLRTPVRRIPLDAVATPPFDEYSEFWFTVSADGSVAAASYSRLDSSGTNSRIATYRIPEGDLLNIFELGGALPHGNVVYDMALSPDGKLLYVTNGASIQVIDAVSSAPLWMMDRLGFTLAAWSSDGGTLFATQGDLTGTPDMPYSLDALDARTGALKWSTDLHSLGITGLALVADGGSLTGPAYASQSAEPCDPTIGCPPVYPFWSSSDGTLTGQLPGLPRTASTGSNPRGFAGFACNATDTCALRMSEFAATPGPDWQTSFVRLYKTDGTELQRLPMDPAAASGQGSMTISPDGKFIAIADDWGTQGGAKVFSAEDGTIVASRSFSTETF